MSKTENTRTKIKAQIVELLDAVNFNLYSFNFDDGKYCVDFGFYSDAGEDFIVTLWFDGTRKDFVNEFQNYAFNFDADEHAEAWVDMRGQNGVPDSIRTLMDDSDSIQERLVEASDKLIRMTRKD